MTRARKQKKTASKTETSRRNAIDTLPEDVVHIIAAQVDSWTEGIGSTDHFKMEKANAKR